MIINEQTKAEDLDSILVFLVMKRMMRPIKDTLAFKLGLVDSLGKSLKEPKTDKEKQALTVLDLFVFKMRRLLGSKMSQLNNFLFVKTIGNDLINKVIVKGTVSQRAEILRLQRELEKVSEKYDCGLDDILYTLLNEQIRKEAPLIRESINAS